MISEEELKFVEKIDAWDQFVNLYQNGYGMCVYEYTNDLACRLFIQDGKNGLLYQKYLDRIENIDRKFKDTFLRTTKKCMYGNYSKEYFWFWMVPPNSDELEKDLRESGHIN